MKIFNESPSLHPSLQFIVTLTPYAEAHTITQHGGPALAVTRAVTWHLRPDLFICEEIITSREEREGKRGWGERKRINQTWAAVLLDSEGGWRCVSYAVARCWGWSAGETGGPRRLHHWDCAAPGCPLGWETCSSFTILQWASYNQGWICKEKNAVNYKNCKL